MSLFLPQPRTPLFLLLLLAWFLSFHLSLPLISLTPVFHCARAARLKAFCRIPSISKQGPEGSYQASVAFLQKRCQQLGLRTQVFEAAKGKPLLIATLPGSDLSLPSICLNSHYDVVPAYPDKWTHPPFAAVEDAKGDIYARGIQVGETDPATTYRSSLVDLFMLWCFCFLHGFFVVGEVLKLLLVGFVHRT